MFDDMQGAAATVWERLNETLHATRSMANVLDTMQSQ